MNLYQIYKNLAFSRPRIEPFHDTWMLWLKKKSARESFEVMVSTILVQNTNWKNVQKALDQLKEKKLLTFSDLIRIDTHRLEEIIRPAGFFRQKARSLQNLSELMNKNHFNRLNIPSRTSLLELKGIGKETADSILVYCYYQPTPIVGTYTRRFFARLFGDESFLRKKYEEIQTIIAKDFPDDYFHLGRFHALIVSHCQEFCNKLTPLCISCNLSRFCRYGGEKFSQDSNSISNPKFSRIQDEILNS